MPFSDTICKYFVLLEFLILKGKMSRIRSQNHFPLCMNNNLKLGVTLLALNVLKNIHDTFLLLLKYRFDPNNTHLHNWRYQLELFRILVKSCQSGSRWVQKNRMQFCNCIYLIGEHNSLKIRAQISSLLTELIPWIIQIITCAQLQL